MGARLALGDGFAQEALEIVDVVVLEHFDHGAGEAGAEPDGGVVQLVGDDQTAFADEGGEGGGVGLEAHGEDHGGFFAYEACDEVFDLDVQIRGAGVGARAGHGDAVFLDGFFHGVGAGTFGLGKAKVVVGRHVEGFSGRACQSEMQVVVVGFAIYQSDVSSWNSSCWSRKAVVDPHFQSSNVEIVEVAVQRCIPVSRLQMLIMLLPEALSEKVPDVPEDN